MSKTFIVILDNGEALTFDAHSWMVMDGVLYITAIKPGTHNRVEEIAAFKNWVNVIEDLKK